MPYGIAKAAGHSSKTRGYALPYTIALEASIQLVHQAKRAVCMLRCKQYERSNTALTHHCPSVLSQHEQAQCTTQSQTHEMPLYMGP
jgi:hypothetical protein